jgi:hypothetical protein
MSFNHMIVGAVEDGFDPDLLWARNPPQDSTYPSNNTMVPMAGPLRKIKAREICVTTMKYGHLSKYDM